MLNIKSNFVSSLLYVNNWIHICPQIVGSVSLGNWLLPLRYCRINCVCIGGYLTISIRNTTVALTFIFLTALHPHFWISRLKFSLETYFQSWIWLKVSERIPDLTNTHPTKNPMFAAVCIKFLWIACREICWFFNN